MKKSIVFAVLFIALLSTSAYSQMQLSTEPFWTFFFDIWSGQHDVKTPQILPSESTETSRVDLTIGTNK